MNVKLKKGAFYCAIEGKGISFGTYAGRTPDHFVFRGSGFAGNYGHLDCPRTESSLASAFILEIPRGRELNEYEAYEYIASCLPE